MDDTPSLSRTSSVTSISSDDAGGSNGSGVVRERRTRKRFSNIQLTMLEHLFHQNSHPSREERDTVARLGGMETKSVTIWFQNKRQTERKVALSNTTNASQSGRSNSHPSSSPLAGTGRSVYSASATSSSSRPSLDRVASRSELPIPVPRTPTRQRNPNAAIWDMMPSSPIAAPFSPPSREYVEFGKLQRSHRTLEWACAAARLAGKAGNAASKKHREELDADWTDDDMPHEAITPPSTWGASDSRWATEPGGAKNQKAPQKNKEDEDIMKAAIALCGLGRR